MNGAARATATNSDERPPATTNGNAPPATQFTINREVRKPLFGAIHTAKRDSSLRPGSRHARCMQTPPVAKAKPRSSTPRSSTSTSSTRSASAMSTRSDRSGASTTTPRGTRLPRPATTGNARSKGLFTIADAYRIAEKEEEENERLGSPRHMDASPSPAPRPWRTDDANTRSAGAQQGRTPRSRNSLPSSIPRRPGSSASQSSPSTSGSSLGRRMSDFGFKAQTATGLFSKSRIGPKVAKTGEVLARKASNSSLDSSAASSPSGTGAVKAKGASGREKSAAEKENEQPAMALLSDAEHDIPNPSAVPRLDARLSSSWEVLDNMSPNKSYAWQMDDEFTAGDLQISNSPRIRVHADDAASQPSRPLNTKLDEIREREAQVFKDFPLPEGSRPRPFNTRLDEIEELEHQLDSLVRSDNETRPKNTKIDEIRALEIEVLSKKALATSRLDEIRAKNSRARPRSASPVLHRSRGELAQDPASLYYAESSSDNADDWVEGERIPNTPVTLFRKSRQDRPRGGMMLRANSAADIYGLGSTDALDAGDVGPQDTLPGRVARASTSPEPEPEDGTSRKSDGQQDHRHDTKSKLPPSAISHHNPPPENPSSLPRETDKKPASGARAAMDPKEPEKPNSKPTVGFVGVRRTPSTESTRTTRSVPHSDGDPTERIEREMQLFAPAENQSDRGSIRVPSPSLSNDDKSEGQRDEDERKTKDDEDGDLEVTPRPKRYKDILSMPTPQVTGAYVETPATIRAEALAKAPAGSTVLADKTNVARRRRSYSVSDKGDSDPDDRREKARAERRRRRARSLPKHHQPLINSAKPPTVRDDLMELQRTHNIEDSTLDDFGKLLATTDVPDRPEIDEMLEDLTDQVIEDIAKEQSRLRQRSSAKSGGRRDHESDLEAITRMTKSLQTGLLGIRSAKQGIERLEDQVSHVDPKLLKQDNKRMEKNVLKVKREDETGDIEEHAAVWAKQERETVRVKQEADEEKPVKDHDDVIHRRKHRAVSTKPKVADDASVTYVLIPVPRLYRRSPFRLTLLGLFLATLALWYAAESAMCYKYCRPTTCSSAPCVWSIDDPTFGHALPRKLDDWTTGGRGRTVAATLSEELSDAVADAWDYVSGTDIRDVNPEGLGFGERRQYRRRLRKKGLTRERVEPEEHRVKWDAWRAERVARERASAAREMGYDVYGESESMNDDERLEGPRS